MVYLGSTLVLSGRQDCIGVRAGRGEAEVVCSFSSGTVEVYNVHNQCCVHSWSLQSSDCLSCPTVYHPSLRKYFAVRNGLELLSWSEGAEAIDHNPQSLPADVHSLLTPGTLPWMGVVYHRGTLGLLGGDGCGRETSLMGRAAQSTKPIVLAAELWRRGQEEIAVVLYSLTGQCHVSLCALREDATPTTTVLMAEGQLSSCCVCESELISAWASGCTLSTNLEHLLKLGQLHGTHSHQHTLTSSLSPMLLAAVSEHYFALGHCDSSSGGGREAERGTVISVWDTRYTTCQARATFALQNSSQLCSLHGFLFAVGSEGVLMCSVECEGGGVLAMALGRGQVEKESLLIVPSWTQPTMDCDVWEKHTRQRDRQERAFLATLTDPTKTPTLESFMSLLRSHPLPAGEAGCLAVVHRMLKEGHFWAREALMDMLAKKLVPLSLTGDLLVSAVARNDWPLVSMALQYCKSVPEPILVQLLQEVLSCQLLSQPRNDALLQQPLSQLPFPLVMSLLEFLRCHITMVSVLPSRRPLKFLPHPSALDWLGLLLDVHFAQLSLVPEARHTLMSLQQQVNDQVELCESLSLAQALREVHQNTTCTSQGDHQLYEVEKLNITV